MSAPLVCTTASGALLSAPASGPDSVSMLVDMAYNPESAEGGFSRQIPDYLHQCPVTRHKKTTTFAPSARRLAKKPRVPRASQVLHPCAAFWRMGGIAAPSKPKLRGPFLHRLNAERDVRFQLHSQLLRALDHVLPIHTPRKSLVLHLFAHTGGLHIGNGLAGLKPDRKSTRLN